MPALNRVQLIGRLGKDPESKYTPTGKKVTSFPLAVSQHWKTNGETKESTEWMNIEAWEHLGDICQEYLYKGSLVYIEGRLKTNRYEEDGEPRYFTKIVVEKIQFLPEGRSSDSLMDQPDFEEDFETIESESVE